MILVFEFRDDYIPTETIADLALKSPLWDLSVKWVVQPGTIDTDVTILPEAPKPPPEKPNPTNDKE